MSSFRRLPIRVAPIAGEALDSWLEAIAHRTNSMHADMLSAVGLQSRNQMGTSAWMVKPSAIEIESLNVATSVPGDILESMVLQHYSERALRINPDVMTINRTFPWWRGRGSRFCPKCLDQTGGRWQLSWRLGWSFACIEHNCLLADACPECGAVQRLRTHTGDIVPRPGRCAHPAPDAAGHAPGRCGADLTSALTATFDQGHQVICTQKIINSVIAIDTAAFGIYRTHPQPRINVLTDIRAVARRVLAYATIEDLEGVVAPELLVAFQSADERRHRGPVRAEADPKPTFAAPARAATAAVGAAVAMDVLNRFDVAEAGDSLHGLITSWKERGIAISATNIGWGKNTTPVLTAAQLAALGPMLNPGDQLRYRIGTPLPKRPISDRHRTDLIAQRLPSLLWPAWSLRMAPSGSRQRILRQVLSVSLLLVSTRLTPRRAATMIGSPISSQAVYRVLQSLGNHPRWNGLRLALIRSADYLATHDVPIDYRRRRQLDYATLLPDTVWKQICRDAGTGALSVRPVIARCVLFERISGQLAVTSAMFPDTNGFRTRAANFPRHVTVELNQALDEHAQAFLASHGISDEPSAWRPPAEVLDGLDLPGSDTGNVGIADLHRAVVTDGMTMGAAAKHLDTSLDAVRNLLEVNPAPAASRSTAIPYNRAYARAKAALPRERLRELYESQDLTLCAIAESVGVSHQVIGRIAVDYDIELRKPGPRVRTTISREWLHDQYVVHRRTLPDLAKESGMSTANMARWAKTHEIPLRAPGGPSHSSACSAAVAASAPEVLRPALAGIGGKERLQRFVAASTFNTLSAAAEQLSINLSTLIGQVNRVERELGTKLLTRADRGQPMQLTADGSRVAAAVRSCQDRGWH